MLCLVQSQLAAVPFCTAHMHEGWAQMHVGEERTSHHTKCVRHHASKQLACMLRALQDDAGHEAVDHAAEALLPLILAEPAALQVLCCARCACGMQQCIALHAAHDTGMSKQRGLHAAPACTCCGNYARDPTAATLPAKSDNAVR